MEQLLAEARQAAAGPDSVDLKPGDQVTIRDQGGEAVSADYLGTDLDGRVRILYGGQQRTIAGSELAAAQRPEQAIAPNDTSIRDALSGAVPPIPEANSTPPSNPDIASRLG